MSPLNIVDSIDTLVYGLRLPYFFADLAEVDRALNKGGMLARTNETTTPAGVRVLAVNAVGQATGIFNTRKPVKSVAATAANRAWLGTQDAVIDKLEAAGVAVERLDQGARDEFRKACARSPVAPEWCWR